MAYEFLSVFVFCCFCCDHEFVKESFLVICSFFAYVTKCLLNAAEVGPDCMSVIFVSIGYPKFESQLCKDMVIVTSSFSTAGLESPILMFNVGNVQFGCDQGAVLNLLHC